ncbi:AAA domain-containing protein [Achromobacter xylosoxidans]|uniref:AAA domain-containing protein n=1 Tax=Alcaligenes xylosoxydans xylosoxydans TaxID=85698 RepID=UPI001F144AA2|nr:AAA domain-containing protein [Achromobacter xylosoxidans]
MRIVESDNSGRANEQAQFLAEGTVVDNKYVISSEQLRGGMAVVYRALSRAGTLELAVKMPLSLANTELASLSFHRERLALSDLSHKNIVKLVDHGSIHNAPYLVLEWLSGSDLSNHIEQHGPRPWSDFYETLGRPLLQALVYTHKRRWAHRDLKPQNIIFDESGTPKIVDFGIARQTDHPQIGRTFSQAGSPPYTPPESDDGYRSDRRDLYSWAAIATSCMSGQYFHTADELRVALENIRDSSCPKENLRKALAQAPSERQETASVLLAELDDYHATAIAEAQTPIVISVEIAPKCIEALRMKYPGLDHDESIAYITSDLNTAWSAFIGEDTGHLHLFGTTLRTRCKINEFSLLMESANVHSLDRARELRESYATIAGVTFESNSPRDYSAARSALRTFQDRLDIVDSANAQSAEEKRRAKWFECWSGFLRDKERLMKVKQREFLASRIDDDGDILVATIEGDFDPEELGPSLILQTDSGKPIILTIIDVEADQVRLSLRSGNRGDIKRTNATLKTNFEAERKSLQKQRAALEDIRAGKAVSPNIGSILSDPKTAPPPEPAGMSFPDHLSQDKRQVLDKAMEVSSILVVNGPPGTGKTTLIAELISAYLDRYPKRRILLSSQTHVALDHIIAKLEDKGLSDQLIRIVSSTSENANKVSKAAEHLTLDKKVKEWCVKVERRSEQFIESYAAEKGANAFELKISLLGRAYIDARKTLKKLEIRLQEIKDEGLRMEGDRLEKLTAGDPTDPQQILVQTEMNLTEEGELQSRIGSIQARLGRLQESLNKLEGMGILFDKSDDIELEELLDGLTNEDSTREQFLPLIKLHLDWLNRLGSERSFQGAVLREARIVAGTCIGLGGTPAFQQDEYDLCIIDEASKATATETLVPMSRSRRTILVGDPKQLPPYIEALVDESGDQVFSDESKKSLLKILLAELPTSNIEALVEQRRMCSSIGELVSHTFYDGNLINIRTDDDRNETIARIYPVPVVWFSTSKKAGRAETPKHGDTYENELEVNTVISQLKEIARQSRKSKQRLEIAVIAAYSAQVALLRDTITQQIHQHQGFTVEVNTVDAFQGREADICIYSVTRSNNERKIGFQREKERLNVALSRARDALIIIGDASFCHAASGANPFRMVIDYIRENPDFCSMRNL